MAEHLSAPMRDRLDALVAVVDDQPHSPLYCIKVSPSNPSVRRHEAASGQAGTDRDDRCAGNRRGPGQRLPADPVPQRADPRRSRAARHEKNPEIRTVGAARYNRFATHTIESLDARASQMLAYAQWYSKHGFCPWAGLSSWPAGVVSAGTHRRTCVPRSFRPASGAPSSRKSGRWRAHAPRGTRNPEPATPAWCSARTDR